MQQLLDAGYNISIIRERIHPVGTYRLSVWKDIIPPPKKSTKNRKWISISIAQLTNLEDVLSRVANELGL